MTIRNVTTEKLEEELATARQLSAELRTALEKERTARIAAEKERGETYVQFADLKIRLFSSEQANEFMRGYLARVNEDDVVREELIVTGHPDEPTIVPKRKPTAFVRPDHFTYPNSEPQFAGSYVGSERRKPRHWITY